MKKIYILLVVTICTISIHAQTASAVVFTEGGEKFTLILNGEKQNATPQANVKVAGLTGQYYMAKIDFEDASLTDFTHKNFAVQAGIEATYLIKQNKKGEFVMRFHSQAEIGGTATTPVAEPTIDPEVRRITTVDKQHTESTSQPAAVPAGGVNTNVTITETTTTRTPAGTGENVNVGMNVGGVNMGVNVNVTGMDMDVEETTTMTTTTRTTTTTDANMREPRQPRQRQDVVVREPVSTCGSPMASASFQTAKKSIADKGFDETRLTVAKQVTTSNCLSVAQIKEVMGTFGFEETKLEYAKFAHSYCTNPGEYYLVNDAFSFSSSIDDLNKYIQSK